MSDTDETAPKFPEKRVQQCALCRFDLSGQRPYYIAEYHLMAVRCPECGRQQPAGVLAQPWRYRRLKSVFMRLWWLTLLAVCVIGGIIGLMAMSQSTAYAAAQPFAKTISRAFQNSDDAYLVQRDGDGQVWYEFDPAYEISSDWWEEVGREELLDHRSLWDGIDVAVLTDWFWFVLIAPLVGMLYRVLFSQSGPVTPILVAIVSALFAAFLTYLAVSLPGTIQYLGLFHPSGNLAAATAGMPIAWMTFGVGLLSYVVAYILAKPMLAWVARLVPTLPVMLGREKRG